MARKLTIVFGCLLFLPGCAKLAHLDQLLTLKAMSEERDGQAAFVEEQNRKFDKLKQAVVSGEVHAYTNQRGFLKTFGRPVFTKKVMEGDQPAEMWLYRYATKYFGSEKVYVYFDPQGNLIRLEHIVPQATTLSQTE